MFPAQNPFTLLVRPALMPYTAGRMGQEVWKLTLKSKINNTQSQKQLQH